MSIHKSLAALLLFGVVIVPAAAQTPRIQHEVEARLARERAALAADQRERYEEIEIMARLLDRGLAKASRLEALGDLVHGVAFSPDGKILASGNAAGNVRLWDARTGKQIDHQALMEATSAQGVYLKGQGVVYTMTLPLHFQKVVGGADKPATQPLTEWDRVRKELRGEKVQADPAKPQPDVSIADAVLHVLADNGKNLTQLTDSDSVTVAITLSMQSCTKCHTGTGTSGRPGMMGGSGGAMMPGAPGGMRPPGAGTIGTLSGTGSAGGGTTAGSGGGSARTGAADDDRAARTEFHKQALLGDLAMKQNDFAQAAVAYNKAMVNRRLLSTDANTELELVEVASKWARALLAQGKADDAERIVRGLAKLTEHLGGTPHADQSAVGKPAMTLPSKLIITVPMKLLSQSAGRISFDEFRKAATIEYLTFDKTSEKPKGGVGP